MTPLDLDELERAHGEIGRDDAFCNSPSPVYRIWDAFPALLLELRARRRQVELAKEGFRVIATPDGLVNENEPVFAPMAFRRVQDTARYALAEIAALEPAAPAKGGEGEP